MRPHDQPHGFCCIDPITMAVAGAAMAGGMAFGGGNNNAPAPVEPPAQPSPQQAPQGSKKTNAASLPSFIGGVPAPPQTTTTKTLLGQ